jgi:CBS domain-containing protein
MPQTFYIIHAIPVGMDNLKESAKQLSIIKKSLYVNDIMSSPVMCVDRSESAIEAIKRMEDKSYSTIIVTDGMSPVGIITERDIITKILLQGKDAKKIKAKDIMTKGLISVLPTDSVVYASNVMTTKKIKKLAVVDENGVLVGIVTQTDIVNSINKVYTSYRQLLWNPYIYLALLIMICMMYLLNIFFFRI